MTKKIYLSASLFIISAVFLSACRPAAVTSNPIISPTPVIATAAPVINDTKKKADYEFVATQSGQVALDLLQSGAEIETKDYAAAGKFVTSINGLAGNESYYWAFYVNGKYAEKGASQTKLNKGDTIKFVYEAVSVTK